MASARIIPTSNLTTRNQLKYLNSISWVNIEYSSDKYAFQYSQWQFHTRITITEKK